MKVIIRAFIKSLGYLLGLVFGLSLAILLVLSICVSLMKLHSDLEVLPNSEGIKQDLGKTSPIILEIKLHGVIASSYNTAEKIKSVLLECENSQIKDRVKGILLCVNSPGGEVFNANEIYSTLNSWKKRTLCPVYVYVEGLCASGAYYISCAADKIYTNDISLIGSIGVTSSPFFNVKEALAKIGIDSLVLSSGKDKSSLSPFKEWTESEKESRQNLLDFFYSNFLDVVLKSRKQLTRELLVKEIGANVFPPKMALDYGLIDEINVTRDIVLYDLVKELGIQDDYRVVSFDKEQMLKKFFSAVSSSPLFSGKMKHELIMNETNSHLNYEYLYGQDS